MRMDKSIDGYQRLAYAVVEQAVTDYTRALRRLCRHPNDINAIAAKEECERFFRKEMEWYVDLDGELVIRAIQNKVGSEMKQ